VSILLDERKAKGETLAKGLDLAWSGLALSSSRRLNVTALEIVGALAAVTGTALVLSMVFWLDQSTSPAEMDSMPVPSTSKRRSRTAPQRQAA
jgi:hypothetical protein